MRLADYMTANGISDAEMAAICQCDRSRINRLRRGVGRPSLELTRRIIAATAGEVSFEDLCPEAESVGGIV